MGVGRYKGGWEEKGVGGGTNVAVLFAREGGTGVVYGQGRRRWFAEFGNVRVNVET